MTDLVRLLADRHITKALVIDDAYDVTPRATDLESADWDNFFDDVEVSNVDKAVITAAFPAYEAGEPDILRNSDEFAAVLWRERARLSARVRGYIFGGYEPQNATERDKLNIVVEALRALGLTCTPKGRDFAIEEARQADIIFIDLFLGFPQSADDMSRAITLAKSLVYGREGNPPLVILMSNSPRLMNKRNDFRDEAGLLGSAFRVVSKADLVQKRVLDLLLDRLANHYEDVKRVAQFVHAWDSSLDDVRKRFIKTIRRLDLSDFAQIRALLLEFEGQGLGEYLLDVCDRVMQHEIEAGADTIAAAHALNKVDLEKYPAPHLAGTSDLQDLVYRMVFQHPKRLELSQNDADVQLEFGDILRWKDAETGTFKSDVSLVVTASCDLMRDGVKRISLLAGTLQTLGPSKWLDSSKQTRTPIIELPDEGRSSIEWHLKDIQTHLPADLKAMLAGENTMLKRIGRLREMYAVEIQQKFLADFGRIGQPANPPATFAVSLSLFYVDAQAKARPLGVGQAHEAVCYVGKDKHRLVISEQICDAIQKAVEELDANVVHAAARANLAALKADADYFARFERGLMEVPQRDDKLLADKALDNTVYLYVARNSGVSDGAEIKGNYRNAPLLALVADLPRNAQE